MIILQDNKERIPWDFTFFDGVTEQRIVHLDTGDYTIDGFEGILTIERKRTTAEICLNVGQKFKAFSNEFSRLAAFEYKYVICEFYVTDVLAFPIKSGIPKKHWSKLRMSGKFILSRLTQLCEENNVELLFCGDKDNAEHIAYKLFKSIYDEKKKQNNS